MRLLNILLGHAAVFGVALIVSASCGVNYPPTAFRCSPAEPNNCPTTGGGTYMCCSDDPAALDLENINAFVTPYYQTRGGEGTPLFSGGNNPLSKSGMCIEFGSVAPAFALSDSNAQGCPVPCNPTWSGEDIEAVCGVGIFCCQTTELEPEDCVFDEDIGNAGCWRPVNGGDIPTVPGTTNLSTWAPTEHATHQDPAGLNCELFVQGLPQNILDANMVTRDDALRACWRRLSVADQRGFCIGGPGVTGCPLAQPTYRNACQQLNDVNFLSGCG